MPNSKSAKKRLRQSFDRRSRNRSVKSALKNQIRKFRELVAAKDVDGAQSMMPEMSKRIDQAAGKGVIHRNRASRLKSRLAHAIVTAKQVAA